MELELCQGLRGRDLLAGDELSREEIFCLLEGAAWLKAKQKRKEPHPLLKGKSLGMIFRKPSTRTRVSFEVAMFQLGGHPVVLGTEELQLSRGETIGDTGRVLSRYLDGLVMRTFAQEEVEELAAAASVPVINGLTNRFHPCQALADLFTIWEVKGRLAGLKLTYVGDGNNVAQSLMLLGAKAGLEVVVATPPGYEPEKAVLEAANAAAQGGRVVLTHDASGGARGADILYTDVWVSMGQEREKGEQKELFIPYQLNQELLKLARRNAVVMHCLPAHRGEEITAEVLDGPQAVVLEQAENRLHVQKAILALFL